MKQNILSINHGLRLLFKRIGTNTSISTSQISFYRIFVGFFFLINLPRYSWLGEVPPSFYKPMPLTITSFMEGFPSLFFFKTIDIAIPVILCFIILGIKTRIFSLLLFLILLVANSFTYSFGKIDHAIFGSLIFLLLSFTNAGVKYSLVPDKRINFQNLSLALFAICLAFGFFTAGYEKAFAWIDLDLTTSGINYWFYGGYFSEERTHLLAGAFLNFSPYVKELMDYTAVAFELSGFLFLIWNRKSWFLYLMIASSFHLVNTLILNISFLSHIVVFGLWLLSPFLIRKKPLLILLAAPLFFSGLTLAVVLWCTLLIISVVAWKGKLYSFSGTQIKNKGPKVLATKF